MTTRPSCNQFRHCTGQHRHQEFGLPCFIQSRCMQLVPGKILPIQSFRTWIFMSTKLTPFSAATCFAYFMQPSTSFRTDDNSNKGHPASALSSRNSTSHGLKVPAACSMMHAILKASSPTPASLAFRQNQPIKETRPLDTIEHERTAYSLDKQRTPATPAKNRREACRQWCYPIAKLPSIHQGVEEEDQLLGLN